MAVEVNGKVIHHEKPTKYSELVFERDSKVEKLKVLETEIKEIDEIILAIDKSIKLRSVGNYTKEAR